jgi:hypothetical protein
MSLSSIRFIILRLALAAAREALVANAYDADTEAAL